jgi:hypothetical protein
MKFSLGEIPDMHLKRLGLDSELMDRLPERTLKALLSGARTSLMRFSLTSDAGYYSSARVLDAKLSLSSKRDCGVTMKVHPAGTGNSDSVQLDPVEQDRISKWKGTVIGKTILVRDVREKKALVGIDPSIDTSVVLN